jgi:hypothetical protein
MTYDVSPGAARAAADRLTAALIPLIPDPLVDVTANLPDEFVVQLWLVPRDALVLVDRLEADVVDRVEVASAVESLAETHAEDGDGTCRICPGPTWPCTTRLLLAQLPGGAL